MDGVRRLALPHRVADPSKVHKAVTVRYVNGEAYFALTALPQVDPLCLSVVTRKEHKMVDGGVEQRVRDEFLWSGIRGQRPPLPVGCRSFSRSCSVTWSFFESRT